MSGLQQHQQQAPPPPPPHRRGPWSAHEDAHLLSLVQLHGPHNWVRIASLVTSRTPKQCRERYHQNLKPSLNHDPITAEEGAMIERLVGEMGKRWAEIARRLHGRSDNAVKNWWNGGMNRRRRMCLRQRPHGNHSSISSPSSSSSSSSSSSPQQCRPLTIDVTRKHHLRRHHHHHNNNNDINDNDDRGGDDNSNSKQESPPLCSPAYTSSSRSHTPGLTSDNASAFSVSPRMLPSPISITNTLPPLLSPSSPHHLQQQQQQQHRRTSLPILHVPGEPRIPEYDSHTHSFTMRYASRADQLQLPGSGAEDYHYLRHKVPPRPQYPTSPLQRQQHPCALEQDTRMMLASILD